MKKADRVQVLEKAYLFILKLDVGIRLYAQEELCLLRDAIAEETKCSIEDVQNDYEDRAIRAKFRL